MALATLDTNSPAVIKGDALCFVANVHGQRVVAKALPDVVAIPGYAVGIATAAALPDKRVTYTDEPTIAASITGVTPGAGLARLSSAARVERVTSYEAGDIPVGRFDAAGTLYWLPTRAVGPGATDAVSLRGFPVSDDDPVDGEALVFDGTQWLPGQIGPAVDPFVDDTQPAALAGATGTYTESVFTYDSSIDAISAISCRYCYDTGLGAGGDLPVLLVMHGYVGDSSETTDATLRRYASYGFVAVAVGKRGARDASGREAHDILDCLARVRALLPAVAHADKASMVGYSGGGGNTEALACKAPDTFTVFASYFGISDYGYDSIDGWWFTRPNIQAALTTDIGDRTLVVDPYRARDSVAAIARTLGYGGYLYMFHDDADTDVTVANSRRVAAALDAAELTNYAYDESSAADAVRWLHQLPDANPGAIEGEWRFVRRARGADPWTMPTRGSVRVNGFIKTKLFEMWLGPTTAPRTTATGGKDHAADVEYDTLTATYRVTPRTGPMFVQVIQGARTKTVEITTADPVEIQLNGLSSDYYPGTLGALVLALDAREITPAGGVVTAWPDISDAPFTVDQSNGALQPAYIADAGDGEPSVDFTGTTYLNGTGVPFGADGANYTVAVLAKADTDGYVFSAVGSGLRLAGGMRLLTTGSIHRTLNNAGTDAEISALHGTGWHLLVGRVSGSTLKLRADGGADVTGTAPGGPLSLLSFNVGAWLGANSFFDGQVAGVWAWSEHLDDAKIASFRTWLQGERGVCP